MKPELASENKGFCSGSTIAACCSASAIITLPTVPGANPGFPLCWTFSCVELQSLQPACRLLAGPSLCGLGLVCAVAVPFIALESSAPVWHSRPGCLPADPKSQWLCGHGRAVPLQMWHARSSAGGEAGTQLKSQPFWNLLSPKNP